MNHDPIQDLLRDGYAVVAGAVSSSRDQRRLMVELARRFEEPTVPAALMRFDQQQTTRWHIDGGPDRGVLMLVRAYDRLCTRQARESGTTRATPECCA